MEACDLYAEKTKAPPEEIGCLLYKALHSHFKFLVAGEHQLQFEWEELHKAKDQVAHDVEELLTLRDDVALEMEEFDEREQDFQMMKFYDLDPDDEEDPYCIKQGAKDHDAKN